MSDLSISFPPPEDPDEPSTRPYSDPKKPGRRDVQGNEWWACDPYPTWYRWDKYTHELHVDHAEWVDPPEGYPEKPPVREAKQVIVMRTDLNMRKGKMIAQGAHASISFLSKAYRDETVLTEAQGAWIEGAFTKICVRVDSEDELLAVYAAAGEAGLTRALITDAGRTEFGGIPTRTCCAIGPDWADEIDVITGGLKLL